MSALTSQSLPLSQPPPTHVGGPVWWIAELFPDQGSWTEAQYLALTTNRLIEFDNGKVEALPVPTKTHQLIVAFFYELIKAFVGKRGKVIFAPYRLRVPGGRYREPDVLYMNPEQYARAEERFAAAADLVMEVVSEDDPDRDYVTKRRDYADVGVPEYWIVDRAERLVLVLRLEQGEYVEHARFTTGETATSHLLTGFSVNVTELLSQQ